MSIPSAALYVHFPYCLSICPYCDFDRQATGLSSIPQYVAAVAEEISRLPSRSVHSVFFGGGTPSLMSPEQVSCLMKSARSRFDLFPNCEITLEANPGECGFDWLSGIRAAGVNRLSIGVQSLDDSMLATLGRRHSADEARTAVRAARDAGLENVSIDLMLGLPGTTVESWEETLGGALELGTDHLSCYILTVDERVPLGRDVASGRVSLPEDDEVAEQYLATRRLLDAAGYQQYEISNWAKPDRASRHNLTYWRDEPYVGVGAGAAGSIDGVRYKNSPSPRRYMASVGSGSAERCEEERPARLTQIKDWLALGLRLREGADATRFESRFGAPLETVLGDTLESLLEAGALEWQSSSLRVSDESILVTNEVVVRLHEAVDGWATDLELSSSS